MPRTIIDSTWYEQPPGVRERIAAGGVVARREGERTFVVLTREKARPDYILPKGGVERGESLEQTAHREIAEEAGIHRLRLLEPLGARSRFSFDKRHWTTTHYFLFTTDQVETTPTERRRYNAEWFPIDDLPAILWPEQRELIESNRARIESLLADR